MGLAQQASPCGMPELGLGLCFRCLPIPQVSYVDPTHNLCVVLSAAPHLGQALLVCLTPVAAKNFDRHLLPLSSRLLLPLLGRRLLMGARSKPFSSSAVTSSSCPVMLTSLCDKACVHCICTHLWRKRFLNRAGEPSLKFMTLPVWEVMWIAVVNSHPTALAALTAGRSYPILV